MPLILAPVGLLGMQHGDGEIHACRAAQAAGIPFTQSTMSICSIEDIAAAVDKPFWFQLYVMKDRGFIKSLIERAIAAKCSALVLTVDLQVIGQRHQDIKNGMTVPPEWSLSKLIDFATKPAWVAGVLQGKRRTFGNLAGHLKVSDDITSLSTWINSQFDTSLNCKDIDWIPTICPANLILKCILDSQDAQSSSESADTVRTVLGGVSKTVLVPSAAGQNRRYWVLVKAGATAQGHHTTRGLWVPAFAGMTCREIEPNPHIGGVIPSPPSLTRL